MSPRRPSIAGLIACALLACLLLVVGGHGMGPGPAGSLLPDLAVDTAAPARAGAGSAAAITPHGRSLPSVQAASTASGEEAGLIPAEPEPTISASGPLLLSGFMPWTQDRPRAVNPARRRHAHPGRGPPAA